IFGAIMPAFVGFANWQIPMMIGAPDMAFARLNNWSFWLLPFAATLLILAYFTPGGAPGSGWTLYAPLTVQQGMGMDFTIFAVISQVIPAFSRKPLFGYASMVYATSAIAILSFIVWAHHMYTVGMPVTGQLFFMYATTLIAVPTGVKVFNWVATMWKGSLTFETPMLFAIGFLFLFTLGGFTGLVLSLVPVDIQLQDTYY